MNKKEAGRLQLRDELKPGVRNAQWAVQRVIWLAMLACLVAAVLGFLGPGLLSDATITAEDDGVQVELNYQRFARMKRPQRLVLEVRAPEAQGDTLSLELSREFARRIRVHSVIPDADGTALSAGGVLYEWQVEDWSRPVTAYVEFQAEAWRTLSGGLLVRAGDLPAQRITFDQLVFP